VGTEPFGYAQARPERRGRAIRHRRRSSGRRLVWLCRRPQSDKPQGVWGTGPPGLAPQHLGGTHRKPGGAYKCGILLHRRAGAGTQEPGSRARAVTSAPRGERGGPWPSARPETRISHLYKCGILIHRRAGAGTQEPGRQARAATLAPRGEKWAIRGPARARKRSFHTCTSVESSSTAARGPAPRNPEARHG